MKLERKQGAYGSDNGNAKLNEGKVKVIKQLLRDYPHITQRRIARAFGVTEQNISYIVSGKTWSHVS